MKNIAKIHVRSAYSGNSTSAIMKPPDWLLAFVLAGCTAAAYIQVAGHRFITLDDGRYVYENPMVASGLTWRGVAWAFTTGHAGNWHPLTWLAHMANVQAFGLNPAGHHLTNAVWHCANAALLFVILRGMSGARWRSALVAGLFALHPLHVESVAWCAELKDLLSTFFGLLALLAYGGYVRRRNLWRFACAVAAFVLSLLAKPMLVALPFALILLDGWPLGRRAARGRAGEGLLRLVLEKAPLLLLSIASGTIAYFAQQGWSAVKSVAHLPISVRLINATSSYVTYLEKTVWPANLAVYYPYSQNLHLPWRIAWGVALLCGLSLLALLQIRRRPYLIVGWLWYLGMLIPVIGLVQVGGQAYADRYTYVPLIGIFLALSWSAADLARLSRIGATAAGVFAMATLIGLGIATGVQLHYWQDTRTLFRHAAAVTEKNWMAYAQLGKDALDRGSAAEAVTYFRASLEINGSSQAAGMMRLDLGRALLANGSASEAVGEYLAAVRLVPPLEAAHRGLAAALAATGRLEEAVAQLRVALGINPVSIGARVELAEVLMRLGRTYEATAATREAVQLQMQFPGENGSGR